MITCGDTKSRFVLLVAPYARMCLYAAEWCDTDDIHMFVCTTYTVLFINNVAVQSTFLGRQIMKAITKFSY